MPLSRFVFAIVFLHVSAVTVFADWSTYLNGNGPGGLLTNRVGVPVEVGLAAQNPCKASDGMGGALETLRSKVMKCDTALISMMRCKR